MRLSAMWNALVVPDDLGYFRSRDRHLVENPGLAAWAVLTEEEFRLLRALADGTAPPIDTVAPPESALPSGSASESGSAPPGKSSVPGGSGVPGESDRLERQLGALVLNWLVYLPGRTPRLRPAEPSLRAVRYAITHGCRPPCPEHSASCSHRLPGELEPAESLDLVDQIADLGAELLILTGGEPMLRHDLFDLADLARGRGLRVNLVTTGSRIRDAATARRIADTFASITVSLDCGTELSGTASGEGRLARTVRGLALLNAAGVKPAIDHVVSPENIAALDDVMAFLDGIEFSRVRMMSRTAVDRGGSGGPYLGWEHLGGDQPLAARRSGWTSPVARRVLSQGPRALSSCPARADCGLRDIDIHVDPRGDVYPRESVAGPRYPAGNLRSQPLREMFAPPVRDDPSPDDVVGAGEPAGCQNCHLRRLRRPGEPGFRDEPDPADPGRLGLRRPASQDTAVRRTPVASTADHRTGRCRVTVRINPKIVWVDDDEEIRLYDPAEGEFQTLNASAAEIWRRLAAGNTVEGVVRDLADAFGGDDGREREAVARDVREFVALLHARGLLQAAEPSGPSGVEGGR